MGQERLPVRKIREVLRLKAEGFSERQIAAAIGSARSRVTLYNDSSSRKSSRVTPRTALPSNRSELTTSSFSREKVLINQSNSNGEA